MKKLFYFISVNFVIFYSLHSMQQALIPLAPISNINATPPNADWIIDIKEESPKIITATTISKLYDDDNIKKLISCSNNIQMQALQKLYRKQKKTKDHIVKNGTESFKYFCLIYGIGSAYFLIGNLIDLSLYIKQ